MSDKYHAGILIPFFDNDSEIAIYKSCVDNLLSDPVRHIMNSTLDEYEYMYHRILTIDNIFHHVIRNNHYSTTGVTFDSDEGQLTVRNRNSRTVEFSFKGKVATYNLGWGNDKLVKELFTFSSTKSARG